MRPNKLLFIYLAYILAACTNVPQTAEVQWSGIYSVSSLSRIPDDGSLTGRRNSFTGVTLLQATDHVPAVLGTHFGVNYVLQNGVPNELVSLRAIVQYPQGGITNTETGKTASSHEWIHTCRVGGSCTIGSIFREQWELRPGIWLMEVWQGSRQLFSQRFDVYLP